MSVMVSFVLSFFPRGVLDEVLGLVGSVSEDFLPTLVIIAFHLLCNSLDSDSCVIAR